MSHMVDLTVDCVPGTAASTAPEGMRPLAREVAASVAPPSAWPGLPFTLPHELEAGEPPEARGIARDQVRLMVSYRERGTIAHARFTDLPLYLDPGDLIVINTSGTLNAALPALGPAGRRFELHLSTHLAGKLWTVELREPGTHGTQPYFDAKPGQVIGLPAGATTRLVVPYSPSSGTPAKNRLWLGELQLPVPALDYLAVYGSPIRYGYVRRAWPAEYYQTVYATEPGSAEMPSAGRPFSESVITRLVARGVQLAPLLLHTGVASLESDELPYPEHYRVPADTAALINLARERRKRVVAVGTTVVRALETVTAADGSVRAGEGWTDLVITPGHCLGAITGLLTGLHEPRSTHLAMLEALAGREHLEQTYAEALRRRYLWHEFGDVHLIL